MPILHAKDIDQLVDEVNKWSGDFQHPAFRERFLPIELQYTTHVDDVGLSPYSNEYYQQQISLYKELSGRDLNQADGELHPVDVDSLLNAPNPIGILDVGQMTEHVRSISIMLSLADLTGQAEVLDMGAGQGIGSEVMAFMGCKVHAVDIDPALSDLSRRRAVPRGLQIKRSVLNFDDLSSIEDGHYDAAFFSQSLHHCLRPWELIERLKAKIKPETGVIGFVGEPINTHWWRHWGLRLDEVSLYVARAHGWFESGWSLEFITDCFERNGLKLDMFKGGFAGGDVGIATMSAAKREAVLGKGATIGVPHITSPADDGDEVRIDPGRYSTLIGEKTSLHGRPAFGQKAGQPGVLIYGPYLTLDPGEYEFACLIGTASPAAEGDMLVIDVTAAVGQTTLYETRIAGADAAKPMLATGRITLAERTGDVEIRAVVAGGTGWTASLPTLRRIQGMGDETAIDPPASTQASTASRWWQR